MSFGLTKVRIVHHGAETLEGLFKVSVSVTIDVNLWPESVETSPSLLVGANHVVKLVSLNSAIGVLVIVSKALTDDCRGGVLWDPEEVGLPLVEA